MPRILWRTKGLSLIHRDYPKSKMNRVKVVLGYLHLFCLCPYSGYTVRIRKCQ